MISELRLEVGGVPLRVFVPSGAVSDAIAARFAQRRHGFAEVLPERRSLPLRVEGRIAYVEHAGQVGTIDLEAGEVRSPASAVLADALVRAAVAWRLAQRGAIYLHSAAIRVTTPQGVRACVFFGASGAGKSTLAAHYGDVISDELSQMESTPDLPASWRVCPTPWWHGAGDPAPLGQLVWVVRGEQPSARRVGGAGLLRALLKESGRYFPIPEFETRVFGLCAGLAANRAIRVAAAEGRVVEDVRAAVSEHAGIALP
jgi:hypothetical protein